MFLTCFFKYTEGMKQTICLINLMDYLSIIHILSYVDFLNFISNFMYLWPSSNKVPTIRKIVEGIKYITN